ncbi:MAG: murein biosynthesis integral membrane protein MurJ [Bacteriovorax sp.]|nr:murein biosynthesis integral membrane protein MurJ [Bacteriovorax sp.]
MTQKKENEKSGAIFVALGIFLSRISGLIRVRVFAHYFGNSDAGDAFNAALKIPNFLQNLFGEGVLSASFIPVYANLIASSHNEKQDKENHIEAAKVASIIGSLLFITISILVLIGIFLTPFIIDVVAPGFQDEKKLLTIKIVQIIFPGTGLLVMSAWCLGILNSHRKFFLSYVAPVIWNASMIGTLFLFGSGNTQYNLAETLAWGLVLGSFLQFAVQFPSALKLIGHFRPSLDTKITNVRIVVRNFFPVVISRGVIQLSAYIDSMLASLLPMGAVSTLAYAQTLYLLPISLFGMSISASELPAMSSIKGSVEEINNFLRIRLEAGLKKIAFFIIPSVCAFIFLGNILVAAILQSGKFKINDVNYVWMVLIGSTIGLLASTMGRLYSSTFYSLKDTKTPLKFAFIRVLLTTVLGYLFAFPLPKLLGLDASFGTAGLTASAGLSGWVEFYLLRRALNKQIGDTNLKVTYQITLWSCAIIASAVGLAVKYFIHLRPIFSAVVIFSFFGLTYFAASYFLKVEEAKKSIDKIFLKLNKRFKK